LGRRRSYAPEDALPRVDRGESGPDRSQQRLDLPEHQESARRERVVKTAELFVRIGQLVPEIRLVRPSARYVGPAPRKPEEVEGWADIAHD